jgi:hypothetical protein
MKVQQADMNKQGSAWFQITGQCMAPLIGKDDLVLAVPVVKLNVGDIVVIAGTLPAVHRVVKVKKDQYLLTKGDNSLTVDPSVTISDLAGKVVAIVKKDRDPIYIQGKQWVVKNYIMACYSRGCYALWNLTSCNKHLNRLCQRFSHPLRIIYVFLGAAITQPCSRNKKISGE